MLIMSGITFAATAAPDVSAPESISPIYSAIPGPDSAIKVPMPLKRLPSASPSIGAYVSIAYLILSSVTGMPVAKRSPKLVSAVAAAGTTLPSTVSTDSPKSPIAVRTFSRVPPPIVVARFCQAALAIEVLPSIVVAASFAVVPAICCFSWIDWIASIWSAKESMVRSELSPMLARYSLASLIRRSISSRLPE